MNEKISYSIGRDDQYTEDKLLLDPTHGTVSLQRFSFSCERERDPNIIGPAPRYRPAEGDRVDGSGVADYPGL